MEADNVKYGPSDGRVYEQHALQTHLGNPDWVKGYQNQEHQPGPLPQEGAPTHYEHVHPNGFPERQHANTIQHVLDYGQKDGTQWHRDEEGNVHADSLDGSRKTYRPITVTASGLGMPQDGMAAGADIAGSVTDTNVPQTPVMVSPMGMPGATVDPNQSTSKPRQMPGTGGDEGPAGLASDESADPAQDGPEGDAKAAGEGEPVNSPVTARRARARRITAMMATVMEENPGVRKRAAYEIAKKTADTYLKEADWHGLDWGNRPNVPDGQWTMKVKQGPQQGHGVYPEHQGPEPGHGVYPEHQDNPEALHGPSGLALPGKDFAVSKPSERLMAGADDKASLSDLLSLVKV